MINYKYYRIKDSDIFNEWDYPNVVNELELLKNGISQLSTIKKEDIVISYLKDHSIDDQLIADNPALTELISSGSIPISHLERLFESCRTNKRFTDDFEAYIRNTLTESLN
jgi:hypothetical protein